MERIVWRICTAIAARAKPRKILGGIKELGILCNTGMRMGDTTSKT
jgi:hypothetical protein